VKNQKSHKLQRTKSTDPYSHISKAIQGKDVIISRQLSSF